MLDVRTVRKQLDATQAELGEMLGVNQSTISRLETGELEIDPRTRLALEALIARKSIRTQSAAA